MIWQMIRSQDLSSRWRATMLDVFEDYFDIVKHLRYGTVGENTIKMDSVRREISSSFLEHRNYKHVITRWRLSRFSFWRSVVSMYRVDHASVIFINKWPYFLPGAHADKIIGGTAASNGQFPSIVFQEKSGSFFCGGTIISANRVLSAAHCEQ